MRFQHYVQDSDPGRRRDMRVFDQLTLKPWESWLTNSSSDASWAASSAAALAKLYT